jgi:beta-lactamase regulating signal transducer with metallopeptidase domain
MGNYGYTVNFTKKELEQIITHEKVHVDQHHSIDILLTQLTCITLWFNPFIWLYNKNLKQNLEFIADKNAQSKVTCKKSYQTTLLKTSMPSHQIVLSNHFYNSLIKKRIVMLHKSKSKKINLIKYAFIIPLLAIFLMSFNTKEVYIKKEALQVNPEENTVVKQESTKT